MNIFSKNITALLFILIVFNTLLSAYWLLQKDIHYDVDVSRDFLVMDDIVRNHHFTLLGPRSGAIPGIFHGPLWFYINLPAFLIGGGNPLVVAWFWFFLSIIFLLIVFLVAKKLFDFKVAIFSALLLSVNSIVNPSIGLKNFYNPYGAVFLTPVFFWWFYQYITTLKVKYLIFSLFTLGFIIQFQMAFGVPVLITITIFLLFFLFYKKRLYDCLAYFILVIPLMTFIIFDLRHNGLQFNALVQFLGQHHGSAGIILNISDRVRAVFFDFFDFFSPGKNLLTVFFAIFFLTVISILLKKSIYPQKKIYWLFIYLFFGFWIISLFFQGGVGNYFWPFLPLLIIIFSSFYNFLNKKIFMMVFILVYLVNLYTGILAITNFKSDINKRGPHSWGFNLQVAKEIYMDAKEDFGYYTFSPDRFAYQQRYAMIYAKKFFPNLNSYPSTKKPNTYLIEVDPPKDRPELDSIGWRISEVGINRSPDQTFRFDFIQVEKYLLSDKEIKIPANPLILDYMFVR
ncbi:hypothetical protein HYS96_02075 [Candidatus Daviesbacteria bacterium]|nr:hypothetical protein [Candidatus Daviesbacteria bacterium]